MAITKIKLANKKFRHEQKRRQKARAEKMSIIRQQERKVGRKHAQLNYLRDLGAEVE
jgi:hypothetical protein